MSDRAPKSSPTLLSVLSETTVIPLSMVLVVGSIIFWASNLSARTDQCAVRIDKLEQKQGAIIELEEQMMAVQTKVDMIYDRIRMHEQAGMIGPPKRVLNGLRHP